MLGKIDNIDVSLTQKKMVKQFFYLIIFTFFAFLLSFFTDDVFAADYGYAETAFSIRYGDSSFCDITSDGTGISVTYSNLNINNTGWLDLDSTANNNCQPLGRLSYHVRGSSTYIYKAGNTYTFRFTMDFDDEIEAKTYMKYYSVDYIQANTSTTSVSTGADLIDNYNFYMKEGSISNRVLVYFVFTPNTDLKYVGINTSPTDLIPTTDTSLYVDDNKVVRGSINYEFIKITYTEGSNAVIQEQTAVIQQQTDKINNSIEELMDIFITGNDDTLNADADSSFNGNSDKFDNYNESETGLKNSVDVDISSLEFDADNYESSFGFVWDNVTNFINSNTKVFRMVIAVLTLSFVGLVIGRL